MVYGESVVIEGADRNRTERARRAGPARRVDGLALPVGGRGRPEGVTPVEYGEGMVIMLIRKADRNQTERILAGGRGPVTAMVYGFCSETSTKRVTPMM